MVDETLAVIASLVVGVAGGFLSSWMAFNASGETFNPRKHGNALITGALVGLLGGAAGAVLAPDLSVGQFILQLVFLFGTAVGIDRLRSNSSDMVSNKAKEGSSTPVVPPS